MIRRLTVLAVTFFSLFIFAGRAHAATVVKFCILAPEGSTWMNVINDMNKELTQKTGGEVTFKMYAGGVCGDEVDVIRKLRIKQYNAAGLSGIGMGEITPEFRILELPFFLENYEEIDYLMATLRSRLEAYARAKGFEVLGFAEAGLIYFYSNKPLRTFDDMHDVKMWMWQGDPVVATAFKRVGLVGIPLSLPDVLTSLQTGLIDAAYGPPLATVAMQWHTKVKYITDMHIANSEGAVVINKSTFDSLSKKNQTVLKEVVDRHCRRLIKLTREDNVKAVAAMKAAGIQQIEIDDATKKKLRESGSAAWDDLAGKLYTAEFLNEAKAILAKYRKK